MELCRRLALYFDKRDSVPRKGARDRLKGVFNP
jgi:hypothetical protein